MEKPIAAIGECVEKICAVCGEERGHVVVAVTKKGQISRVECPKCNTRSSFKVGANAAGKYLSAKTGTPYEVPRTYRTGQILVHPSFGPGEVTAVIEPQKIDVLFSDRLRRLIHARAAVQAQAG